jgi:alpha-tubulin suppressor-like RCC1 family protein
LALTSGGYVLSWGHNRFSQLGYPIEPADNPNATGKFDDTVQISPRRIVGPLKKEWVVGVAAGRMSSACWTKEGVWTWGTNAGHLGYEKMGNPVQVLPRKVTAVSQVVIDIALSVGRFDQWSISLTGQGLCDDLLIGYQRSPLFSP